MAIPGLPGGLVIYQGHLFPLKGLRCFGALGRWRAPKISDASARQPSTAGRCPAAAASACFGGPGAGAPRRRVGAVLGGGGRGCRAKKKKHTPMSQELKGCGSKPFTPGERQNRCQMDVHPPKNGAIGYARWPKEYPKERNTEIRTGRLASSKAESGSTRWKTCLNGCGSGHNLHTLRRSGSVLNCNMFEYQQLSCVFSETGGWSITDVSNLLLPSM